MADTLVPNSFGPTFLALIASISPDEVPLLHLKRKVGTNWEYSSNLTGVYLGPLHMSGMTFEGKNSLLTGVGKGSTGSKFRKVYLQETRMWLLPHALRLSTTSPSFKVLVAEVPL